jgi:uncharacterized protein
MWPVRAIALSLAVLAGCGGGTSGPTVLIHGDESETEVEVEIADTTEERARGLMGRESLPDDAGMLFVFSQPNAGGFWMKDTLIPLSIAFVRSDGRIVRILDMEPCRRDPCPVYDPGVTYVRALEVNRGAFKRWGVEEGDKLEIVD